MVFYVRDNFVEGDGRRTADNALLFDRTDVDGRRAVVLAPKPFAVASVTTLSPQAALESVLERVGACLPARDAVDRRLVEDARQRRGRIIDSQSQVGGWPVYRQADALVDSDMAGMPDDWERAQGLNPHDPSDAARARGDGYTNIEEYINSLLPRWP